MGIRAPGDDKCLGTASDPDHRVPGGAATGNLGWRNVAGDDPVRRQVLDIEMAGKGQHVESLAHRNS